MTATPTRETLGFQAEVKQLLVQRMKAEIDSARFDDLSHILFDQSLLAEGGQIEDPAGFVKRLNEFMLELAGRADKL